MPRNAIISDKLFEELTAGWDNYLRNCLQTKKILGLNDENEANQITSYKVPSKTEEEENHCHKKEAFQSRWKKVFQDCQLG